MIVRIMGEGQSDVADQHFPRLNQLDDELLEAIDKGEESRYRLTLNALLDAVRELGEPVPPDSLEPSELILPRGDATIEEVRTMLGEDGLIPG